MRLKTIKIAGFKSFVDSTVIPIPSQRVAIVGPNGCGKSNIIDAVRWVMGEGSAKSLRGESMVDVIFKGSTHRKPVGQASVELVFDNSLGTLSSSSFSQYQEIVIQRLVDRNGDSNYLINGTRCRRRDVVDLFFGTGAGARGYSVIGQDTVSKLVEARPEVLRFYWEEAAGVSKYKERRRETLQRIAQTATHIEQLEMLQSELTTQADGLKAQSVQALEYKALQTTARQHRVEIYQLTWNIHTQESIHARTALADVLSLLEASMVEGNTLEAALRDIEQKREITAHLLEKTKIEHHALALTVAREEAMLQQKIQHCEHLQREHPILAQRLADIQQRYMDDGLEQAAAIETIQQLMQVVSEGNATRIELDLKMEALVKETRAWEQEWSAKQKHLQEVQHTYDVHKIQLTHLEKRIQEHRERLLTLDREQPAVLEESCDALIFAAQEKRTHAEAAFAKAQLICEECLSQQALSHEALLHAMAQLHALEDQRQRLYTEYVALGALIRQHPVNVAEASLTHWQNVPRVIEHLAVEAHWQGVLEWVMGHFLQAIVVENVEMIWSHLSVSSHAGLSFSWQVLHSGLCTARPTLASQLKAPVSFGAACLEMICTANSLEEARTILPSLLPYQSVITPDGYWLGHDFLRIAPIRDVDEESVLVQRSLWLEKGQALAVLDNKIQAQRTLRDKLTNETHHHDVALQVARTHESEMKIAWMTAKQALLQCEQQRAQYSAELSQWERLREVVLNAERTDWQAQKALQQRLIVAEKSVTACTQAQATLLTQQTTIQIAREVLENSRTKWQTTFNAVLVRYETEKNRKLQLDSKMQRDASEQLRLQAQFALLLQEQEKELLAQQQTKETLCVTKDRYDVLTRRVNALQVEWDAWQAQSVALGQQRNKVLRERQALQERQIKMTAKLEAVNLQLQYAVNGLEALGESPESRTVSEGVEKQLALLEEALLTVTTQLAQYGAVNLMAIEAYEALCTRLTTLTAQHQDLVDATRLLQVAIDKLDGETVTRLRDTFEALNEAFSSLFPRLFGGGQAKLVLTGTDWLEAGIQVMAEPPGKRNHRIQLLSGGEKSMTAIALVFAFFQLNPSPFCLLDEVDAALDDLNVHRFIDLVKNMSSQIQFLFITHNKVTMEMADHLIGVTMREPGVSRVVTVDVEQAILGSA